jgi:hypothetical protein
MEKSVVQPVYTYTCPRCSRKVTLSESEVGQTVTCPNCALEFDTCLPPAPQSAAPPHFELPARLPFFKSGRRDILLKRLEQLLRAGGVIDAAAETELKKTAIAVGLQETEASDLLTERFTAEFDHIKRRMESSFVMTDEDVAETEQLKRKYNVRLNLKGNASLFRAIYLLESKHQLPSPLAVDLMLESNEICYYEISTTWVQTRMQTRGYSGTSVSVPLGLRGVRFRFGGYTPVRTEQMTPLSTGTLYVTSKRIFFNGDSRNTTVGLKKIIDGHVFSDCVRIDKSTGKPDFFSMNAPQARFVLSLIDVLRSKTP